MVGIMVEMVAKVFPSLAAILLSVGALQAQETVSQEVNSKGDPVTHTVAAGSAVKEIQFWYISRGSITTPLSLGLYAPQGASAAVEAAQLKGSTEQAFKNNSIWQSIALDNKLVIKKTPSMAPIYRAAMAGSASAAASSKCGGFPEATIQQMIDLFESNGVSLTHADACYILETGKIPDSVDMPDSPNGGNSSSSDGNPLNPNPDTDDGWGNSSNNTSDSNNSSNNNTNDDSNNSSTPKVTGDYAYAKGLLHKDECAKKMNRYLVRVKVSLANVDSAAFASGFDVAIRLFEIPYKGPRAATIKPVSDGKFAPAPLALLTAGGWGSNERIEVYRWKNGKAKLLKTLRVEDHVYARGYRLARAVASSVLRGGGKANFEWVTDTTAYNVCFSLSRSRQNANGYPSR